MTTPDPKVARATTFICLGRGGPHVTYAARPAADVCGDLMEDVGDWWQALRSLPSAAVPPGVLAAIEAFHETLCGWSTFAGGAR